MLVFCTAMLSLNFADAKKRKGGDVGDSCPKVINTCKKGLKCVGGTSVRTCVYEKHYSFEIDCYNKDIPKDVAQSNETVRGFFGYKDNSSSLTYSKDFFGHDGEWKLKMRKGVLGWERQDKVPVKCGQFKRAFFDSDFGAPTDLSVAKLTIEGNDPLFIDQIIYRVDRKAKKHKIGDENGMGWCLSKNKDAMSRYESKLYRGTCFTHLLFDPYAKKVVGLNDNELSVYEAWLTGYNGSGDIPENIRNLRSQLR